MMAIALNCGTRFGSLSDTGFPKRFLFLIISLNLIQSAIKRLARFHIYRENTARKGQSVLGMSHKGRCETTNVDVTLVCDPILENNRRSNR
jgi:mannose-1-phosphate guanylyltransferase